MFSKREPVHITLDSGATSNYIRKDICKKLAFKIRPNSQTSVLGDQVTKLPAIGEINEVLTRDNWSVRLRALVVETLSADVFGGTVFHKENDIATRMATREITVNGKHRVFATDMRLPLPQATQASVNLITAKDNVIKINSNHVVLPGEAINIPVHSTDFCEGEIIVTEPRNDNKNKYWPTPQLCTVNDGTINVKNKTLEPIIIGDDVHMIGYSTTSIKSSN